MDGIIVCARQETEALLLTSLCSFSLMKAQQNESCVHVPEVFHVLLCRGEGLPLHKQCGTAVFYITSL